MTPETYLRRDIEELRHEPTLGPALEEPEEIGGELYADAPSLGISFTAGADGRVSSVFLFCTREQGHEAFPGPLPHGLSTQMDRDDVRRLHGPPERSGEPRTVPVLGPAPAWDRYEVGDTFVHVRYRLEGPGLSRVTLMTPEAAPGRG